MYAICGTVCIKLSLPSALCCPVLVCSRHFFGVREVQRLLDLMALYKLNKLHLHLCDDQASGAMHEFTGPACV